MLELKKVTQGHIAAAINQAKILTGVEIRFYKLDRVRRQGEEVFTLYVGGSSAPVSDVEMTAREIVSMVDGICRGWLMSKAEIKRLRGELAASGKPR